LRKCRALGEQKANIISHHSNTKEATAKDIAKYSFINILRKETASTGFRTAIPMNLKLSGSAVIKSLSD
jgi:hypothetical protein